MIYLDNASTSFPKPKEVNESIQDYLLNYAASPGRGAHKLSEQADAMVDEARTKLASFIGAPDPSHVVFTMNATHGLNVAIKGILKPGDHVLICNFSHNSVIRPVDLLQREGIIEYDVYEGTNIEHLMRPNTRLVICTHASNVTGDVADYATIAHIAHAHKALFMVDSTQSLGYHPIDLNLVDVLVGTGHKTLMGPTGIGFFYVKDPSVMEPLMEGGSGGNFSLSPYHPKKMPHKFEAGTVNGTGIAGLLGALKYIEKHGFARMKNDTMRLMEFTWQNLCHIDGVTVYGTHDLLRKIPVISFNIAGKLPSEIAYMLGERNICIRSGIHCAPLIHKSLGTLPTGTLRISLSHFSTQEDILNLITTLEEVKYEQTCA